MPAAVAAVLGILGFVRVRVSERCGEVLTRYYAHVV